MKVRLAIAMGAVAAVGAVVSIAAGGSAPKPTAESPPPHRQGAPSGTKENDFLDFAQTPRRPGNLLEREGVAGRSADGRPIRLRQFGDPALRKSVLVFGCIHGDECGASGLAPTIYNCPDPYSNVYVVPNLNPDGASLGTRLNARGVDLNRNFPAAWTLGAAPGDPEYPGSHPLSEPESRLATRIVARLEPRVTIWFHQHRAVRPLIRAWGQSVPSARRFARLAGLPFKSLPWLHGTAPNWQNHRFPGTGSFVVELPQGRLGDQRKLRLQWAIVHLARWVSHDGHVVRTR